MKHISEALKGKKEEIANRIKSRKEVDAIISKNQPKPKKKDIANKMQKESPYGGHVRKVPYKPEDHD